MTAWNPCQLSQMALPPCHILCQFYVNKNELSCHVYQRSGDVGLGIPFNILSYSILTHLIAEITGLYAYELILTFGDTHIYMNHIDALRKQITREPYPFPKIRIQSKASDCIDEYNPKDIKIYDYKSHDKIYMEMTK